MRFGFVCLVAAFWPALGWAQFKAAPAEHGPRLEGQSTQRIKIGVIIKATGGTVQNVVATVPVPDEWPEQQVRVVDEDIAPSYAKVDYRQITGGGGVRQLVLKVPRLAAGLEARALITFEVTRRGWAAPADTASYRIPQKLNRDLTIDLGTSPYIESRHPKIVAAAKAAVADHEGAWEKAEAIYDWVREHVIYEENEEEELKGAARALFDGDGGADEVVSVFIAMCRAQKIPARTVFVLGHCYAEFYLEDASGQGHWFPCQPAGVRAFGSISNLNPILQKGDNFRNPEDRKERLRYVTEYLNAAGRGKAPKVKFISELIAP
ncbi:MAG: transglutaminase domain-containing protein [Pirellulales bacterium]